MSLRTTDNQKTGRGGRDGLWLQSGTTLSSHAATLAWQPIAIVSDRLNQNLSALDKRDARLAERIRSASPKEPHFIAVDGHRITMGRAIGSSIEPLPNPVPPAYAAQLADRLFPQKHYAEPVLVAGLDQGWILDVLYRMEVKTPLPMYRPPLYVMVDDLTKLWLALHFQHWQKMLADARVMIFAGPDAVEQYSRTLSARPGLPLPQFSLTVEPGLWPAGQNADAVHRSIMAARETDLASVRQQIATRPAASPEAMAERFGSARLRVLGITSRFTTFLQHSMRDWLAGFRQLGHETRLVMEPVDHQNLNNLQCLQAVAEFQPDVILLIDHYRAEFKGLPEHVPCVMWVQDRLPNIFCKEAGKSQSERDFCAGFGRLHLAEKYGYPAERFLPTTMGVNEHRFRTGSVTAAQRARFACEVSYVSHASATAEVLLQREIDRIQCKHTARHLRDMYDRLRAHTEADGNPISDVRMRQLLRESAESLGLKVDPSQQQPALEFFRQQIANALFRHQALQWVAECGVDLRLYGRGWEAHPTLARYARGIADNQQDLCAIYQSSKINLQVTPFGAMHQRLLDGLATGGFFLLRHTPGDDVGRLHRRLWQWIGANGITRDEELHASADAEARRLMEAINQREDFVGMPREFALYDVCRGHAELDFLVAADSVWPEYDDIAFKTPHQLRQMLTKYLSDDGAREAVARSMRDRVIEHISYTSINRRLLALIAKSLKKLAAGQPVPRVAA